MRTGRRCSPPRQPKPARGSLAAVGRAWRGDAPSLATVAGRAHSRRSSCAPLVPLAALCLAIGSACGPLSEGTETSGAATESSSTGGSAAETSGLATTGATDASTTEMTTMTGSTMTGSTMTGSTMTGSTIPGSTSTGSTGSTSEATNSEATDSEATDSEATDTEATATDSDGSTGDATGETGDGLSFAAEIFPLFVVHCSCHKVSYPDAETAFAALVDQPSMGVPELTLVAPYDVAGSYLLNKLNDTQLEVGGLGAQMPPKNPLSPEELDLFDLWVSEGAAP